MADDPADNPQATNETTILCPHCVAQIGPFDHFCPQCGGQVTAHGAIDPLGQVFAAGNAYRNATSQSRPKLIIVLGMWLIFAPQIVMLLFFSLWIGQDIMTGGQPVFNADGWTQTQGDSLLFNAVRLLLIVGLVVLYAWIIWTVTSRYRTLRHITDDFDDEPDNSPQ